MTEPKQPDTKNWDDFMDTYFKADHVGDLKKATYVVSVSSGISPKGKPQLICNVNYNGNKFLWDVNVTNMRALRKLGVKEPKDLENKNLYFEKVRVRNPSTGEQCDSLEVVKIQ